MICSIGGFVFEAHDVLGLGENSNAHFGEYRPYGDDPHYHNTQGSTKQITITGRYIAEPNSKPHLIEQMLRAKAPVRFTMATGESEQVIITDFSRNRKNFITHSGAVYTDFTITLKRTASWGFGIFSILGAILAAIL